MGKNKDRESLIRVIVNVVVHEIVLRNTNRPESKNFVRSEIIEYSKKAKGDILKHNWNEKDREYIRENGLDGVKNRMKEKYYDIDFDESEIEEILNREMSELFD